MFATIRDGFRVLVSLILAIIAVASAAAIFFFGSIIMTVVMAVAGIGLVIASVAYGIYDWWTNR